MIPLYPPVRPSAFAPSASQGRYYPSMTLDTGMPGLTDRSTVHSYSSLPTPCRSSFNEETSQASPVSIHMMTDTEGTCTDNDDDDDDDGDSSDEDARVVATVLRALRMRARDTGCRRNTRRTRGQRHDPVSQDVRPKRYVKASRPQEILSSVTRSRTAQPGGSEVSDFE